MTTRERERAVECPWCEAEGAPSTVPIGKAGDHLRRHLQGHEVRLFYVSSRVCTADFLRLAWSASRMGRHE